MNYPLCNGEYNGVMNTKMKLRQKAALQTGFNLPTLAVHWELTPLASYDMFFHVHVCFCECVHLSVCLCMFVCYICVLTGAETDCSGLKSPDQIP